VDDTFPLTELLADDDDEHVQKADGRTSQGSRRKDIGRLREFLQDHARRMQP
jgi:hypothetical protein